MMRTTETTVRRRRRGSPARAALLVLLLLTIGLAGCAKTDTVQAVSDAPTSSSNDVRTGTTEAATSTSSSTTSTTEKTTTTRRPTTTKAPTSSTTKRSPTTRSGGTENGYTPEIKQAFVDQCSKSASTTTADRTAMCQCVVDEIVATIPFAEFLEISQEVAKGKDILSTKLGPIITTCALKAGSGGQTA